MNKAVFLDRDGTINIDTNYLHKPEDIVYLPKTYEGIILLQRKGYKLFIVTNQSGIDRGLFSGEDVERVHNKMQQDLISLGLNPFDGLIYCPSFDDSHPLRKPNPGMINNLAKIHEIDLSISYMIGDKNRDAEAGIRAGCKAAILGYDDKHPLCPNYPDLEIFANWIA